MLACSLRAQSTVVGKEQAQRLKGHCNHRQKQTKADFLLLYNHGMALPVFRVGLLISSRPQSSLRHAQSCVS